MNCVSERFEAADLSSMLGSKVVVRLAIVPQCRFDLRTRSVRGVRGRRGMDRINRVVPEIQNANLASAVQDIRTNLRRRETDRD
jgi:hypothetical protein